MAPMPCSARNSHQPIGSVLNLTMTLRMTQPALYPAGAAFQAALCMSASLSSSSICINCNSVTDQVSD